MFTQFPASGHIKTLLDAVRREWISDDDFLDDGALDHESGWRAIQKIAARTRERGESSPNKARLLTVAQKLNDTLGVISQLDSTPQAGLSRLADTLREVPEDILAEEVDAALSSRMREEAAPMQFSTAAAGDEARVHRICDLLRKIGLVVEPTTDVRELHRQIEVAARTYSSVREKSRSEKHVKRQKAAGFNGDAAGPGPNQPWLRHELGDET